MNAAGPARTPGTGEKPASVRIHFVRHGEVENPERIYYGRLSGFPLSERGVRQARAAAQALRREPLAAIYSSPLARTRQTAEHIAAEHQELGVVISDLLIEVNTPYDGLTFQEIAGRPGDAYTGTSAPYDRPEDVLARMLAFVEFARDRHGGRTLAAVTHGDAIAFLWLWAAGLPPSKRMDLYREHIGKGSITTMAFGFGIDDERPLVVPISPDWEAEGLR